MNATIHIISLGCPKNLIDSEVMTAQLAAHGYRIVQLPEEAEIILINTCAFIDAAKEESIETILNMAELKMKGRCRLLVVSGCLSQRYGQILEEELPEVDLFLGINAVPEIHHQLETIRNNETGTILRSRIDKPSFLMNSSHTRILATAPYYAYLKIAEGCSNHCSYCIIPKIRGPFRSRPLADILREAETLAEQGVREIILTAQDTTAYGTDLPHHPGLDVLMRKLCRIEKIRWIRLLYTYPTGINDDILEVMATEAKICRYLDIPVQHIDDDILDAMNRKGSSTEINMIIQKIRSQVPGIALRTSLIIGFPGETSKKFKNLLMFTRAARLDHVGTFEYSREEDTPAAGYDRQVSAKTKASRRHIIMEEQAVISHEINQALCGAQEEVLITGQSDIPDYPYIGRARRQAPDIDGITYVKASEKKAGDIIRCRIVAADTYDLYAEEDEWT